MHETAVAQSILENIISEAEKHNRKPVSARVSCGQFNTLNDEAMQFAFEIASGGTICEGMTLEIRHVPLKCVCEKCGEVFDFDLYSSGCDKCKSEQFRFEADAPLLLEEIELQGNA